MPKSERKHVMIMAYGPLYRDPRVLRQITWLKDNYNITAAGSKSPNIEDVAFINISPLFSSINFLNTLMAFMNGKILKLLKGKALYRHYYWNHKNRKKTYKSIRAQVTQCDLIIANDYSTLPLAVKLKSLYNCKLIFDAHEYAPLQAEYQLDWHKFDKPYRTYLCKEYIPHAEVCFSVSEGICKEYERKFGNTFEVLVNAPEYDQNIKPTKTSYPIKIVHHGAAVPNRHLENTIELMRFLSADKYELHLILVRSNEKYYRQLEEQASKLKNVFFHDLVPTKEISKYINQFDIGIVMNPANSFNMQHGVGNKFFEFIQARLCIAVVPKAEQKMLTERHNLGLVFSSFDPKTSALEMEENLSIEKIDTYKEQSHNKAKALSALPNESLFKKRVDQLCII